MKIEYVDSLYVERRPKGTGLFFLTRNYTVLINSKPLMVPAGTHTDFASFPKILGLTGDKIDRGLEAAVVHDYLYRPNPYGYTRKKADDIFLAIMKAAGVSWFKRYRRYWAVRSFGWIPWRKNYS